MPKKISGALYFGGIGVAIIFGLVFPFQAAGPTSIASLGALLALIGWIGALVKTARSQHWGWFLVIFFIHGLGMLLYMIVSLPEISPPDMRRGRNNLTQKPKSIHWTD